MPPGVETTVARASRLRAGLGADWTVGTHHRAAFVFLLAALGAAAWRNLLMLNPDAVAYLRIAGYYARGQTELMISGYWGPMLSWLLAPLLRLGWDPLVAARTVMALCAVVFWCGCVCLFRGGELTERGRVWGAWLAALAAVFWSVRFITPDLLVSGLMCLATGAMLQPRWLEGSRRALLTGGCWGLAYLSKAVALPVGLLVGCGLTLLWRRHTGGWRRPMRQLLLAWLGCALVAGPWVLTLSRKYQAFTFSTSARIAHAVVGPPDHERYHPFMVKFHHPPPGRVTAFEDPDPSLYRYWSPLESPAYFLHQVRLIGRNLAIAMWLMTRLIPVAPVVLFLMGVALCRRSWRAAFWRCRWFWTIVPLGGLVAVYVPVFLHPGDDRYLYASFPLLWMIGFGLVNAWPGEPGQAAERLRSGVRRWWLAAWVLPSAALLLVALAGLPRLAPAGACARRLADQLKEAGVSGPIAGSAPLRGGRAGLYTAFFLDQPWLGDELRPTPEGFRRSGAKLVIVNRRAPVAAELARAREFRDLDAQLFGGSAAGERFPLKVFEVIRP